MMELSEAGTSKQFFVATSVGKDKTAIIAKKPVLATGIKGRVKWFNVKCGYGFISRFDNNEDVFVHHSAIVRNNPRKAIKSVGDGELVQFDIVVGRKGHEAANVSGPNGAPVRGSQFAANVRIGQRYQYPRRVRTMQKCDANFALSSAAPVVVEATTAAMTATANEPAKQELVNQLTAVISTYQKVITKLGNIRQIDYKRVRPLVPYTSGTKKTKASILKLKKSIAAAKNDIGIEKTQPSQKVMRKTHLNGSGNKAKETADGQSTNVFGMPLISPPQSIDKTEGVQRNDTHTESNA